MCIRDRVLEPRDHLGVAERQRLRDLVAVGRRQVLLVEEPLLELVDLLVGERRARLAPLLNGCGRRCRRRQTGAT